MSDGQQGRLTAVPNPSETTGGAPVEVTKKIRRLPWSSKRKDETGLNTGRDDPLAAFSGETDRQEQRPNRLRRSGVRASMLGVVATFAVLEAGLIGYWMYAGRRETPTADGLLRVTSRPTGKVPVDGTLSRVTPLALPLPSGEHRVEIETAASFGSLEVATEPPGASISIDGLPRGATPIQLPNVPAGPHEVVVTSNGQSFSRHITVKSASTTTVFVPVINSTAELSGWMHVSSPVILQLYEDAQLLGTTEIERIMLPVGRHEIEFVSRPLDYRATATLQVTAGKTTTFAVKLPSGVLYVNALPWADVWIDDQRVGETPLANMSVSIGTHEVLFRHPQLGEQRRTVVVKQSGATRIGVEFGK